MPRPNDTTGGSLESGFVTKFPFSISHFSQDIEITCSLFKNVDGCLKGSDEGTRRNLPRRDGAVGFLEQTEGCFGVVVSGFVDGAIEQDEVSPSASDV